MEETGFPKNSPFYHLYTLLSVYAHSEGLSAIQLEASLGDPSYQLIQSVADSLQAIQLTCILITSLVNMWPAVRERFETLPQALQWDIEILAETGKQKRHGL